MKKFILAALPSFVGILTALLMLQMVAGAPTGTFDFIPLAFGDVRFTKYKISSTCTSYTITNTETDVTNLTVTLKTTGRPVHLFMQSAGALGSDGTFSKKTNFNGSIRFYKDGSALKDYALAFGSLASNSEEFSVGAFQIFDVPTAASHTYKIRAVDANSTSSSINNTVLVAYELP